MEEHEARLIARICPGSLPLHIATRVLPVRRRARRHPPLGSRPGPLETRTAASSHSHCSCRSAELSHFGGSTTRTGHRRRVEKLTPRDLGPARFRPFGPLNSTRRRREAGHIGAERQALAHQSGAPVRFYASGLTARTAPRSRPAAAKIVATEKGLIKPFLLDLVCFN